MGVAPLGAVVVAVHCHCHRRGCWGGRYRRNLVQDARVGERGSVVGCGKSDGVLTCRKLLSLTEPQLVDGKAGVAIIVTGDGTYLAILVSAVVGAYLQGLHLNFEKLENASVVITNHSTPNFLESNSIQHDDHSDDDGGQQVCTIALQTLPLRTATTTTTPFPD